MMEFEYSSVQSPSSMMQDPGVIHQLQTSIRSLHDNNKTLMKEQHRMKENIAKLCGDIQQIREEQTIRLEEISNSVNTYLKKIFTDLTKQLEDQGDLIKSQMLEKESNILENLKDVEEEIVRMRKTVPFSTIRKDAGEERVEETVKARAEMVNREVEVREKEVRKRLEEQVVKEERLKEACIVSLEDYIADEVMGQIVSTLEIKIGQVRTELQEDLEEANIKIEDVAAVCGKLKNKVADLENPRRTFDETELYSCSVDDTIRSTFQRGLLKAALKCPPGSNTGFPGSQRTTTEIQEQICSTRDSSVNKTEISIESPEEKEKDFSSNSERRGEKNDGDTLERLREDVQECQFKLRSLESLLISTSLPSHKRVSDTHSYQPRAHSFGSDLSRDHKFGATVLTPEQQLRKGRVHLLPCSGTKHTENNFTSEMEKRAKELVLEPTQEYMRNNIARALVSWLKDFAICLISLLDI